MKKKNYLTPKMDVNELLTVSILDSSNVSGKIPTSGSENTGTGERGTAESGGSNVAKQMTTIFVSD